MQLIEVPILILVVNFKNPILPIALFPTPSHSLHQLLASTDPHSVFHLGMLL